MAGQELIDQCVVWCATKGLEPIVSPVGTLERGLMVRAVSDYTHGTFQDLNAHQRRVIAGVDRL